MSDPQNETIRAYGYQPPANRTDHSGAAPRQDPQAAAPHPEETCQRCGRPNVVWYAPNEVWNRVMDFQREGILCPVCFIQLAEKRGVKEVWRVEPGTVFGGAPSQEAPPEPLLKTPESLQSFLEAAAAELTRILPELQVTLGKLEAAKAVSKELLRRQVSAGLRSPTAEGPPE